MKFGDTSMLKEANLYLPDWEHVYRLIPSHFPPINLFEQVSNPEDLDLVFAIEALTNDRLRDETGELSLVPTNERISGIGSTPVMAAFTHVGIASRFSVGEYGVYYGANCINTGIAESSHARAVFFAATNEPDTELTMRCYINRVALEMHDIRGADYTQLQQDNYTAPQLLAAKLRNHGSNGLIYSSARYPGGECVAAFKPKAVTITIQGSHYRYLWNSKKQEIDHVLKLEIIK
jgi:hypothetical protein